MIRRCSESDLVAICVVINDAAQAYKGVLRADCWHEPYMSLHELAADWAIRFYEHNGYAAVSPEETDRLLRLYWKLPERQIVTSVVLVKAPGITPPSRCNQPSVEPCTC